MKINHEQVITNTGKGFLKFITDRLQQISYCPELSSNFELIQLRRYYHCGHFYRQTKIPMRIYRIKVKTKNLKISLLTFTNLPEKLDFLKLPVLSLQLYISFTESSFTESEKEFREGSTLIILVIRVSMIFADCLTIFAGILSAQQFLGDLIFYQGIMYRVCHLRLDPDFGVWSGADKKFYLLLTVFTEKCLQSRSCIGINFMTSVNCRNPKTEMQSEIIKMQVIEIQIWFLIKQIFLLYEQQTCFLAI